LPRRSGLARRPLAARGSRLSLALLGRLGLTGLTGLTGGLPPATAAPPPAPPLLIVRAATFGARGFARTLGTRGRDRRHNTRQATRSAPAAGLLAGARVLLLDALFEFGEPLLHRPFELGTGRARFLRPDARTVRANGFGRRIGVGRLGFDRDLRREFRHLPKF
jgi:hypothetical protein